MVLERIEKIETLEAFGQWLAQPREWVGGFDFPFGLPRELVEHLGVAPPRQPTVVRRVGRGLAARLMEEGIAMCAGFPVTLGAQAYLEDWYARFGFVTTGPGYVEDGIPHVPMRRDPA